MLHAWFWQYLIASFQNSVRKVQMRAISSNVAGKDVDDPCLPTGTGKSHLYSCRYRLVENQALRHSDSIICQDCAFKASAGCKAA